MQQPQAASWRWAVVVAAVTFVVFLPALQGDFVSWDDDKNFVDNFAYRGLGLEQLDWMWSTFHLGHYVPLSWMTLGLDYLIWGMNPRGYHLTNLLLHSGVAVVVYAVARRVLALALTDGSDSAAPSASVRSTPRRRPSEQALGAAAAVAALLFALHPLRVESVAWITERRDLLSGFFYFAAIYCYMRAAGPSAPRRWYIGALVAAASATLAKASAVTLPAALVALELYLVASRGPMTTTVSSTARIDWHSNGMLGVIRRVAPFGVLALGPAALAFVALQPEPQLSIAGKVAVSAYSICFYLWKMLVPMNLSPLYAMPERVDALQPAFLLAIAATASLTGAAIASWRRWPAVTMAWLATIAIALPFLGVHQNGPQIAADRYTYNASVALALLAAGGALQLYTRFGRLVLVATAAILVSLGTLSWRQTYVWRDSATLWARVLEVEPNSPVGRNNAGNLLMKSGRVDEAIVHYRAALASKPRYAEAHDNLGVALASIGRTVEAVAAYQRALEIQPSFDAPHNNWGVVLARQGQTAAAIERFRLAIAANPANSDAHVNWGNAELRLGRTAEAIAHYQDALRFRPTNADAHHNWGVALARAGDLAGAATQFTNALALQPTHLQAREYLERVQAAARR